MVEMECDITIKWEGVMWLSRTGMSHNGSKGGLYSMVHSDGNGSYG
jgi:hypothetical protein